MGFRRQARESALQILYLVDVGKIKGEEASRACLAETKLPPRAKKFAEQLSAGALLHSADLDKTITKYAENWEIGRMAAVDRNILRLAAFELLHYKETPVSVVIDEAVEIAKSFSTHDSGKFVNGILDKIKIERENAESKLETGKSLPTGRDHI